MDDWTTEWPLVANKLQESQYLQDRLNAVRDQRRICPPLPLVMQALRLTPRRKVRIVIIGQDPYHSPGTAHGLAFSSMTGLTPSLKYIFLELHRSHGQLRKSAVLTDWAEQGVLLLNMYLTTERGVAKAHEDWGWEEVTRAALMSIRHPVVTMAWGNVAQQFTEDFRKSPGLYLTAVHPVAEGRSNGARPFVGCNHFALADQYLKEQGQEPVNWFYADQQSDQLEKATDA